MTPRPESRLALSVVSPVFQAEHSLEELVRRLVKVLGPLTADSYEIILVDDGSTDKSWQVILRLAETNPRVRGVRLSRNFGQHVGIVAGLSEATADRVVLIDCDLQDQPEEIPELLARLDEGHQVVLARCLERPDSFGRGLGSGLFFLACRVFGTFYRPGVGTFSAITRTVAQSYLQAADLHAHYLTVLHWLGFAPALVDVRRAPRPFGPSSYSWRKLVNHAFDGLTSQTTRLLQISSFLGIGLALLALLQTLWLVYRKLFLGVGVDGWASLMVVTLITGGTILLSLGINGLYLGRLYERSRNRPLFIVAERC